ncbi:MAG: MATE family efflux transporter, partial [Actinomycetes bacterium]
MRDLDREIIRLALPALGALVAEPLFVLADSAIVAHLGTRPLAALGVAGAALTTLVAVFVFLAYGTTAIVSRRLGAGQREAALRIGVDGLWLGAGLGVAVAALGVPLAPLIARGLGAPPAVVPDAALYLRLALLAAPAMLLTLAATGLLRGLQDTRTTLLVAGAAAIVNTALNAVLVLGLGWGLAGSAIGTAVTQWLMALAYLATLAPALRREDISLRPRRSGIWRVAREGVPLLLRTLTLRAAIV